MNHLRTFGGPEIFPTFSNIEIDVATDNKHRHSILVTATRRSLLEPIAPPFKMHAARSARTKLRSVQYGVDDTAWASMRRFSAGPGRAAVSSYQNAVQAQTPKASNGGGRRGQSTAATAPARYVLRRSTPGCDGSTNLRPQQTDTACSQPGLQSGIATERSSAIAECADAGDG